MCHIAITSNLSDLKFGMEQEIDGKMFKAVIVDKKISPLPYLTPFTFNMYSENNKLYVSTKYSYLAYTESVLGYEINFNLLIFFQGNIFFKNVINYVFRIFIKTKTFLIYTIIKCTAFRMIT